jgi:uncharacterized protein (DUF736 family)
MQVNPAQHETPAGQAWPWPAQQTLSVVSQVRLVRQSSTSSQYAPEPRIIFAVVQTPAAQ